MNKNYSDTYKTPYQNNAAGIYFYKSDRKNAKILCNIQINHLINHKEDRKVDDKNIYSQIVSTLEKIVYFCKNNRYLRYTAYVNIFKQADYINANNEIYHSVDNTTLHLQNKRYSIEQIINDLYDIYYLIYPYNTISKTALFSDSSIRYYINKWYNKE